MSDTKNGRLASLVSNSLATDPILELWANGLIFFSEVFNAQAGARSISGETPLVRDFGGVLKRYMYVVNVQLSVLGDQFAGSSRSWGFHLSRRLALQGRSTFWSRSTENCCYARCETEYSLNCVFRTAYLAYNISMNLHYYVSTSLDGNSNKLMQTSQETLWHTTYCEKHLFDNNFIFGLLYKNCYSWAFTFIRAQ